MQSKGSQDWIFLWDIGRSAANMILGMLRLPTRSVNPMVEAVDKP